MVQKATPATNKTDKPAKHRGRPPEFDRDEVIDAAIGTFWTKGVEHTTLADLEAATGTVRTTLYNSFDGKDGLHRAAAERYVQRVEALLFHPLSEGRDGLADVVAFFDLLGARIESGEQPPGCLIANDLTSPGRDEDATDRYLASLERGLRAALGRAVEGGELEPERVDPLVDWLVATVIGVNVVNRRSGATAALPVIAGVTAMLPRIG